MSGEFLISPDGIGIVSEAECFGNSLGGVEGVDLITTEYGILLPGSDSNGSSTIKATNQFLAKTPAVFDPHLIRKYFHRPADLYMLKHQLAMEAGIPVPNMYQYRDQRTGELMQTVIIENLLAEGAAILVDKSIYNRLVQAEIFDASLEDFSGFFAAVNSWGVNDDAVEGAVRTLAQSASDNRMVLPADNSLGILVYPNHEWRIYLLDLSMLLINRPDAERQNEFAIDQFMKMIREIRGMAQKYSSKGKKQ